MKDLLQVRAVIYWVGLTATIPSSVQTKQQLSCYLKDKGVGIDTPGNPTISFFGTYTDFIKYVDELEAIQSHSNQPLILGTVIIRDAAHLLSNLSNSSPNIVDMVFDSTTLQVLPKDTEEADVILSFKTPHLAEDFLIKRPKQFRDYYKEVLATYRKVTFFDQFNTFKYVLNKDLRKELEDCVYRYFIGVDCLDTFRDAFRRVESQLKPSQLAKYQTVKDFALSDRTSVLKSLVEESDQERLKAVLDKYSLDYFDVNYLKAYLRDYGKTKEEKSKRKERVQSVQFTETSELDVTVAEPNNFI